MHRSTHPRAPRPTERPARCQRVRTTISGLPVAPIASSRCSCVAAARYWSGHRPRIHPHGRSSPRPRGSEKVPRKRQPRPISSRHRWPARANCSPAAAQTRSTLRSLGRCAYSTRIACGLRIGESQPRFGRVAGAVHHQLVVNVKPDAVRRSCGCVVLHLLRPVIEICRRTVAARACSAHNLRPRAEPARQSTALQMSCSENLPRARRDSSRS